MTTHKLITNSIRPATYWGMLSSIVALNLVLLIFTSGSTFLGSNINIFEASRSVGILILPILASMFSRPAQDVIAHFKIRNVLPGCRAVALAGLDPRIDIKRIKAGGRIPAQGSKQNAWWYTEFYQKVKMLPEVVVAHRRYILFRDLAFFQGIAVVVFAFASGAQGGSSWWSLLSAFLLYVAFVLSTRNRGEQFVQVAMAVGSS